MVATAVASAVLMRARANSLSIEIHHDMAVFIQNPDVFIPLLAMIAMLAGSATCSASETALFFLSDEEVKALQVSPKPADQRIVALLKDRKSTRLNSSHIPLSRMPSSA